MTTGKVIDQDLGWNKLRGELRRSREHRVVSVGIQGEEAGEDHEGLTNVELAAIHEWGTRDGHVPERSFIRSTIDENSAKYHDLAKRLLSMVIDGKKTTFEALSLLGLRVVADIRRTIQRGIPPPNAESTIRQKHSSKPLIDKGQLINSITYKVTSSEDET